MNRVLEPGTVWASTDSRDKTMPGRDELWLVRRDDEYGFLHNPVTDKVTRVSLARLLGSDYRQVDASLAQPKIMLSEELMPGDKLIRARDQAELVWDGRRFVVS